MPEKFQKIKLPSFWMSYISVPNINDVVKIAEELGGKIEVRPEEAPGGGLIALIRDPAGAGFTCYQGESLGTSSDSDVGMWHELHVSDISTVDQFYSSVFGWDIRAVPNSDRHEIYANQQDKNPIASIRETSNEIKGPA